MNPPRIFISAAEQSADEHAAGFIRAFVKRHPLASFKGVAGPAMRQAGCTGLHDMTARSAMALAAVRRVPEALRLLRDLKQHFAESRYDAAVLVDSPTLHLPLAKICRRFNIPVLYFIAPQTWAWAPWRNGRIRKRVSRIACILPFEETYFQSRNIPARYVGHPTFDRLSREQVDPARIAALRAGAPQLVLLLPGSRRHVVEEVLPGQLEIAETLAMRFPAIRFLLAPAGDVIRRLAEPIIAARCKRARIEIVPDPADRGAAIRAADLALAASGTITLEVAYHATPMIVMYNANRWVYHLFGRWLITTPHFALPNILAGREIVPEFMPYYRSTDPIAARAAEWLATPASLARVREHLHETMRSIARPGAFDHAAAELESLLNLPTNATPMSPDPERPPGPQPTPTGRS